MNKNISPHIYVFSTALVVTASLLLLEKFGSNDSYIFLPVLALGIIYAIINFYRQQKGPSVYSIDKQPDFFLLIKKALVRYIVWLAIIYLAYTFYTTEPYYSSVKYKPNTIFFESFLNFYLIVGMPYFLITGILKSSRIEDYYDPVIRIIHISKQIVLRTLRGDNIDSIFRVFKKKYNIKVLLNLLMRTYFIPVMVTQVYNNFLNAQFYSSNEFTHYNMLIMLYWLTTVLWLADVINASLSYCVESRWMENRSRSIDLTFSGWAVCLFCYAPLNNITGSFFFFAPNIANNDVNQLIIENITFLYAIKIFEIIILMAHIYTDVSLGPSVVNVTLKKLQTRGFYGIVRHPGTTLKLMFWLSKSIFYKSFWKLNVIFGYIMWAVIYVLRALTEERHLNQHEEYREYKKKVKYRFIPRWF